MYVLESWEFWIQCMDEYKDSNYDKEASYNK